jgi:thiamine-phosphate pyrophosphorylase
MKPLSDCRLYTFIDSAYLDNRDPVEIARQLCDGGSDIIQLRAKDWSMDKIRKTGEAVLKITNAFGVRLVINDHPDLAHEIGAPACHLGQEDFFDASFNHVSELTRNYPSIELGLSTHAPDQAERALDADPAYIAIGPVFATATKPDAKPVTLEYVLWDAESVTIHWFAIGGINLLIVSSVLEAGATRICVVSAILDASSGIAAACSHFKEKLTNNF